MPFATARRVAGKQIVAASAGVSIKHAESRGLLAQICEYRRQNRVLMNVGEITGVKRVAVIHRPRRLPGLARLSADTPKLKLV
jgi:hypothetical protein